jgi:hypothetical protein
MDPLSISASIAGLITLADVVFSRTHKYYKGVKNAGEEIKHLASEIRALAGLLHGLRLTLEELEAEAEWTHFKAYQIYACNMTLTNIRTELDKHSPGATAGLPLKTKVQKLKWPFSLPQTKELLSEVERHKSTISMALVADDVRAIMKVLSNQTSLSNSVEEFKNEARTQWAMENQIRMDDERRASLQFFGKVDPLPNHRTSLKLRYPTTGLWLTEGLAFKTWLQTQNSKLWLSGIPGAGKTVLAAAVIEEAMIQSGPDRAVAYFYCDYKDKERQELLRILGSLAAQLARQSEKAFGVLQDLYLKCCPKDRSPMEPDIDLLAKTLRQMLTLFDDVSIIVDALDECGDNAIGVAESLVSLGSGANSNTRTLLLSRDEIGIRQVLQNNDYIQVAIAAQSEDLKIYVQAEIESRGRKIGRGRLALRSTELKEEIMSTLVEKADGM